MANDGDPQTTTEKLRRFAIFGAAILVFVGIVALLINAVWGPKFKRDGFCGGVQIGKRLDFRTLSTQARAADRIPVITIDDNGSDNGSGNSRKLDPPGPTDPEPPQNLSGNFSVNFGTADDQVSCLIRFKDGIVASIRRGDE
jgi:hypothetical protein